MNRTISSGFTLLEVLVVILILGILFAIGIISYLSWINSMRAEAAAADIIRMMTTAVGQVRSKNIDAKITVSGKRLTLTQNGQSPRSVDVVTTSDIQLACRTACATNEIPIDAPYGTFSTDTKFTLQYANKTRTIYFLGPAGMTKIGRS